MEKYFIGTDIGTTYAKVILFNSKGQEADIEKGSIGHYSDKPGYMEMDMLEVYEEVCLLVKRLMEKNNLEPEQVLGLGVGGQSEGLWPVGFDGNPCGRAMIWCDTRAAEYAGRICAEPEKLAKIIEISGGPVTAASGSMIGRWMMDHEPERFENMQWFGTCFDWLKFKMTGEITMSSSYTADLLDIHKMEYSDELFRLYGVEALKAKMAPVRKMSENYAALNAESAEKMGLLAGIPVVGGPFDMLACALGVGAVDPGIVAVVLGTSNIVVYPQSQSKGLKPEGMAMERPHACDGRWTQMTGTMTCTPNFDWAISRFGKACGVEKGEYVKAEKVMEEIPIGCNGLIYHPYLSSAGERAPMVNSMARAQFTGLTLDHTDAHMLRAVYEGVLYSIYDCMQVLKTYNIKEIRVAGGGGRSPFVMQMLADISGVKTIRMKGDEEGARGSALIASVAAGKFDDMREAAIKILEVDKEYFPNPENTKKYREVYALYKKIWTDSEGFWAERENMLAKLGS